jgi:hypothetical protein
MHSKPSYEHPSTRYEFLRHLNRLQFYPYSCSEPRDDERLPRISTRTDEFRSFRCESCSGRLERFRECAEGFTECGKPGWVDLRVRCEKNQMSDEPRKGSEDVLLSQTLCVRCKS